MSTNKLSFDLWTNVFSCNLHLNKKGNSSSSLLIMTDQCLGIEDYTQLRSHSNPLFRKQQIIIRTICLKQNSENYFALYDQTQIILESNGIKRTFSFNSATLHNVFQCHKFGQLNILNANFKQVFLIQKCCFNGFFEREQSSMQVLKLFQDLNFLFVGSFCFHFVRIVPNIVSFVH